MAAVAPLIGGWLVGTVGWPAIFYINLPLALGAILLAASVRRREPRARRGPHGLCRRAARDGGLGGLTYALTLWSATRHFTDAAMASLTVGAAMLGAFLWVELRRGHRAMMPLDLFGDRASPG